MSATHLPVEAGADRARGELSWRTAWTKAPFLAFCWLSFALVAGVGTLLFYTILGALIHYLGDPLDVFGMTVVRIVWLAIAISLFLLGAGLLLITLTSLTGIDLLYPHNRPSITVNYLFPAAALLARFFGVKRNTLRVSFVKVNNAMTIAQRKRIRGDRILVLLPHCLQIDVCNRKITNNIENCVGCGKCPVADLRRMGAEYGLHIEVVNGGTLARRKVKSYQPDGIVAVACERDLTLGIQDVYPVPVYGVINDRPNGPCYNTDVDLKLVEEGIRFFKR
ncbi:MAG: DUF116 domain-containing protein [Chitinivibrionales bacterium]|nr:DUF116 domain-containing protein [Chitinivibrionales bacterium]